MVFTSMYISVGAALDPKDDERRTPLYLAASYGANSVVTFLMNKGADVTIRDTMLKSVVHAAVGDATSMAYLLQVSVVIATANV